MFKLRCVGLFCLILSGCGMIDNAAVSDQAIQNKTASSLGVKPSDVTILNREAELDSVHFDAKVKGKLYQCYYTSVVVSSSDVICNTSNGSSKKTSSNSSGQCNALLKAANKC